MSALALDQPGTRRHERAHPDPGLFGDLGGEPTLDEVLSGAWEGLVAHHPVDCPWCGNPMTPEYGAHARPIGGCCEGCDARLS